MRRPASLALTAAALVAALAGCGGGSSSDTATTSAQATGAFPKAGIAFTPPPSWSVAADSTFQVIKAAPATIAGKPAVQIRARETIAGQPRTVRSTHIYAHGAEYVIDAYADADSFRQVDAKVFRPLLRSLHVSPPE
jgi:hypothetical protein